MTLEHDLAGIVGDRHVVTDRQLLAAYETDWTRRFSGRARAVVRPAETAEVSAVLLACGGAGVPIQIQGGNTGLVGGSVPAGGEVVLSTTRLTRLDPVHPVARQVTAGAGVTLAVLQQHARAAGLAYGVDLAARDSATVGGTIATNAGGIRVVRYGDTRRQVRGVEAVLADGSVVEHLAGLGKDNTGYDLAGLLTGSEGTLGVVTAARLRLVPAPGPGTVTLVGCGSVAEAQALVPAEGARAAELMLAHGVELVSRVAGLPPPLARSWPVYLLLETDDVPELPDGVDAVVHPRLWDYRERLPEAIATQGVPHKLDVSLPPGRLAEFVDAVTGALAQYDLYLFGHLAESNVHVNVVGPLPHDDTVDEVVLRLVTAMGGSISAEHGIGRAKVAWLPLNRGPGDLAAMRAVKQALDPRGLLNTGVLLG